jgi:DNA sulfur modification protein DndE
MNIKNIQLENILIECDNGMVCRDATGVKIKNLKLVTKKMSGVDFKDSRDVSIDGLYGNSAANLLVHFSGPLTGNVILKNVELSDRDKQLIVGKEVSQNAVQVVK